MNIYEKAQYNNPEVQVYKQFKILNLITLKQKFINRLLAITPIVSHKNFLKQATHSGHVQKIVHKPRE